VGDSAERQRAYRYEGSDDLIYDAGTAPDADASK
jgi:hypothetical protein